MGRYAARHSCPFCDHYATDMCVEPPPKYHPSVGWTARIKCCGCKAFGPLAKYCESREKAKREATALWNKQVIARCDESGARIGVEALSLIEPPDPMVAVHVKRKPKWQLLQEPRA